MLQISEFLKNERIRLGLTQDEIAQKCGISKRAYNYYEKGERKPSTEFLLSLAQIGGDINFILSGKNATATLDATEQLIINEFRRMNDAEKLKAISFMSGLNQGSHSTHITQSAHIAHTQTVINGDK